MRQAESTQTPIDALFWKISLQDDEEAFRQLFYTYFPSLCVFAGRYIQDKVICEDIAQEAFLNIWKNRKTLNITTSARNFLVTCVRNGCIDYIRKSAAEENYRVFQSKLDPDLFNASDDIYTITELEEMINSSLMKLPEHIRYVFEQNRFEGKTYAEIAKECDLSVKTIESYMSKALKLLRYELKDYLPFVMLFL